MASDIEIFVGTSQEFLLSFKIKKTDVDQFALERFIAHRCHNGSIICMDTKGRYLATGGSDDRIVVIDLKLNRDVHEIIRHEGSINSLLFTNKGSDLLSGSEDGRLVATSVGSWQTVNIWKKPHTGKAVLKVCLHKSDKFALTLGKDGTLRGWDMFKGSQINTFNTKDLSDANIILDNVELSPDGNTFAMSGAKTVALIGFTRDEPYDELTLKSRVTSMCWLDDENLLIGMENGSIEWTNIIQSENVNLPDIHTRRIKGMHRLNGFLGTICSNGTVSLWAITISTKELTLICTTIDESIRPTCIKLIDTTENRYKEPTDMNVDQLKNSLPSSEKKSQTNSTAGKVIVETDGNENDDTPTKNQNWKLQISDDETDTEIVITPEKKNVSKKKVKLLSNRDHVPSATTSSTVTPRGKKVPSSKTAKITVRKPIVVRSFNSDDDFETKRPQKKEKMADKTAKKRGRKPTRLKQGMNTSIVNETGGQMKSNLSSPTFRVRKETQVTTPMSCPTIIKQGDNSQKSNRKRRNLGLNRTEEPLPTHLMATRNKRKNTV